MNADELRRFNDFRRADRDTLATVLKHSRELLIAADRHVVGQGRQLPGRYYLLAGCVQTTEPAAIIDAGGPQACERLYPGVGSIRTRSPTRLLQVDWDRIAFLFALSHTHGLAETGETWESRFLGSPMMQLLTTADWRALLGALSPRPCDKGIEVVRQGERADCCFVLAEGHAVVHRGRRTLTYLMPGDLFGEDALVTGQARNATVTMLENGVVLTMPQLLFSRLLQDTLVDYVRQPGSGRLVNVGMPPVSHAINVSTQTMRQQLHRFDRAQMHFVIGGSEAERALATLLLSQAGFRAVAVQD